MKLKTGDKIKVIAGKEKGKEGKIVKILKADNKVVIEGLNIVKKHMKPRNKSDKGEIIEVEAPIHISNVKSLESNKGPKNKKETKTTKKTSKKEIK